jgi:two-component system nitrogen regulation sensor histidine kinase GlnL
MKNIPAKHASLSTLLMDNLNTAVMLLTSGLRIGYLNPAAEMLLAISLQRHRGYSLVELFPNNLLIDAVQSVIDEKNPIVKRGLELNMGYGNHVTVNLVASPLRDVDSIQVLVEMTQIDRQLRISREEGLLAQGNATRALVRGLAHEIKNPLGGLRGAAQLLERELHNEELKEYTQVIINEADRLQVLMDEMLGPNKPPKRQMCNIHQATERVRQVVSADFSDTIEFIRDYDPSIPEVCVDLDQLIQALMNLVRNAAQSVNAENGNIRLKTRSVRQFTIGQILYKLVAKIDVIDNGAGIDESMAESIFLPMITGRADGTGLGLPIAQSLINSNGGLIEWKSRAGYTKFTILLPIEARSDCNWG